MNMVAHFIKNGWMERGSGPKMFLPMPEKVRDTMVPFPNFALDIDDDDHGQWRD